MASEDKRIKIIVEIDQQALQRVRQSIADVVRDLQSFQRATQGGGPGMLHTTVGAAPQNQQQIASILKSPNSLIAGGPPQQAGSMLAQTFVEAANAMKGLSGVSRDTMRIMSDAISRAVGEQKRVIGDLDRQIESLTQKYTTLGSEAKDALKAGAGGIGAIGMERGGIQAQMTGLFAQRGAASTQAVQLQQAQAMITNTPPPPPAGGAGPGGGPPAGGGWAGTLKRVGGVALAAEQILSGSMDELQAQTFSANRAASRRSGMALNYMQRLAGGDISLAYAMQKINQSDQADLLAQQVTGVATGRAWLQAGESTVGNAVGRIPIIGSLMKTLGMGGGGGGAEGAIFDPMRPENVESAKAADAMKFIDTAQRALTPMEQMSLGQFQSEANMRIAYQRAGLASGSRIIINHDTQGRPIMDVRNNFGMMASALRKRGYDEGGLLGAQQGLVGLGGFRFAGANADAAMRASAAGVAGFGNVLAGAGRMGGNAFTAMGRGIDQAAGAQLGQSVWGSGFDPTGNTSGSGLMASIQSGFGFGGGIQDFNTVSRIGAGIGAMDTMLGGKLDPYQQGRNIISAIQNNPGGSIYSQDYLATGMNTRQMMDLALGGGGTAATRAMGITPDMARKQIEAVGRSVMDRWVDQQKNDRMSNTMRAIKASGGDPSAYFSNLKGRNAKAQAVEDFGTFMGIETKMGLEAGLGYAGLEAGFGKADIKKLQSGGVGRGLKGPEKDLAEQQGDMYERQQKELDNMGGNLSRAIKTMDKMFSASGDFGGKLDQAASDFVGALIRLRSAMDDVASGHSPAPYQPAKPHR